MENFLYPTHPLRCIIMGLSNSGKTMILTNLILNIIKEFEKYVSTVRPFIKIYTEN